MDWNIPKIIDYILNNNHTSLSGLSDGAELYLLSKYPGFFVYVVNGDKLEKARYELEILGKKPTVFPYFISDNKYSLSQTSILQTQQIIALFDLITKNCDCLILQSEMLYQPLPSKENFASKILNFEISQTYEISKIISALQTMQYTAVDKIEKSGQFSHRGDILDIYPINSQNAFRLSFFDDELESIKLINLSDNTSSQSIQSISVSPNTLFIIDQATKNNCLLELNKLQSSISLPIASENRFKTLCNYCVENLEQNPFNMSNLWAQSIAFTADIFDYLDNCLFVSQNRKELFIDLENSFNSLLDKKVELFNQGECLPIKEDIKQKLEKINDKIQNLSTVQFEKFLYSSNKSAIELECLPVYNYKNKKESLIYDVKELLDNDYQVVIFCPSQLDQHFLTDMFQKQFIHFDKLNSLKDLADKKLYFYQSNLPYGIIIKNDKIAFIPCGEKNIQKIEYSETKQAFFELPKAGDYVVHDFHGIGLCQGIQTLEISNFKRDYIIVQYQGTDKLYLPVENADQLSKYIGQENPKLNKIGGAEFERAKNRVREQMELLAYDLLEINYYREHATGHQYQVNTFIDKEFASAFPYQETPDQLKAIEDINADMSSPKIMDRLICGDVGYGKTEVAFRVAMTAINNGKQVVMLVPTTILSEQHYKSALSRFSGFGVKIEVLNRFKTPKQIDDIHKGLLSGEIDFLIGTQKVLNSQIKYKDLGLLILDEEQRLGVNDKEKIKRLKANLDVLSMSATPIPRTLNMALTGVRDISTINTPPKLRKSVETTIIEYSDGIVFNAIQEELKRNGQVLVITDKIEGIENITENIQKHFPQSRVCFAHAKMTKIQLEDIALKLFAGEIDVLVSTTLIENGIDLPNANTLIVLNADRFGLAQLYQLRGRVGRSDRQAYAYFCFASYKELSTESSKRLQAIQDFTDLGSGFKIAMRDLELRGAGTMLGEKQSGHLEKVGYDMYCRLLAQAVEMAKGKKEIEKTISTKIDVDLNTEVPIWFISDEGSRFEIINKISKLETINELEKLKDNLEEIYGKLPDSINNLMLVALTKNLAQKFCITDIFIKNNGFKAIISQETEKSKVLYENLKNQDMFSVIKSENRAIIKNNKSINNVYQLLSIFQKILQNCLDSMLK